MDIRTLGNPVTIVAAILVVGVLSLLIFESRAVKDEYHVSHAERARAIETAQADIIAATVGNEGRVRRGYGCFPIRRTKLRAPARRQ